MDDDSSCAGIGAFYRPLRPNGRGDFWAKERAEVTVPLLSGSNKMNADTLHAALGVAFTAIWLFVGQILVGGNR